MKFQMLFIISLMAIFTTSAVADTVGVMDEQKLKGKVISIDNKYALFELGGQQLKLERTKIKSITFEHESVEKLLEYGK